MNFIEWKKIEQRIQNWSRSVDVKETVCVIGYNQGQKKLTHLFKTGAFIKHLVHLLFHSF